MIIVNEKVSWVTIISFMLLFVGCTSSIPNSAPLSNDDKLGIESTLDAFVELDKAGDWDRYFALFTDDAVVMPPNGPSLEAIAYFKDINLTPALEKELDIIEIDGQGGMAYVRFRLFVRRNSENAPTGNLKGVQILKKQAKGSWLISSMIVNSDRSRR